MKTIYFITSNIGKIKETKAKLSEMEVKVIQKNIGYPEIQAETLKDVVIFGVNYLQNKINSPFILEDAGLFIDKLKGFPGVYSSYVFYSIGCSGILKLLDGIETEDRKANFKSLFAYSEPNKKPRFFIGDCHGSISIKNLGKNGFGYDPIFIPDGDTRTFAQMDVNEKNSFSHRGKSLEELVKFFKNK